jgi:hypothetical protein
MCLHFDSDIKIDFIFVIPNSLRNTLEKPYGVSGVVDGDTGNRSNERLTNLSVPNFVNSPAKSALTSIVQLQLSINLVNHLVKFDHLQ